VGGKEINLYRVDGGGPKRVDGSGRAKKGVFLSPLTKRLYILQKKARSMVEEKKIPAQ